MKAASKAILVRQSTEEMREKTREARHKAREAIRAKERERLQKYQSTQRAGPFNMIKGLEKLFAKE